MLLTNAMDLTRDFENKKGGSVPRVCPCPTDSWEHPLPVDRPELDCFDEKPFDCWQELLWFGLMAVSSVRVMDGQVFHP